MAAEVLSARGMAVDVYDAMPSVGRKFLLAGRGGLNLTHAEPTDQLVRRFAPAPAAAELEPWLRAFDGPAVRAWAGGLGIDTFVGTSNRVFPTDMKAAPLLRAWLHRLRGQGVRFHMRHRWQGWTDAGDLQFLHAGNTLTVTPAATVLALGGASWARLGSDGAWVPWLSRCGIDVAPLQPANCGFDVRSPRAEAGAGWSAHLRERAAGEPVKPVALSFTDIDGRTETRRGEFVLTESGVEGSLIYAFSGRIRDRLARDGEATVWLDLLPDHRPEQVLAEVVRPRGPRSLTTHLKSRLGLHGVRLALVHECLAGDVLQSPEQLAAGLKALPVQVVRARPIDEAISSAGGVRFSALDDQLMLRQRPGVFCAGEMLDWEAPTGGYLLTACLATGRQAAAGVLHWLKGRSTPA